MWRRDDRRLSAPTNAGVMDESLRETRCLMNGSRGYGSVHPGGRSRRGGGCVSLIEGLRWGEWDGSIGIGGGEVLGLGVSFGGGSLVR